MLNAVKYAHALLGETIARFPDGHYIDATLGNGNDSLFILSNNHFNKGQIYAFDIQSQALDRARQKIESAGFDLASSPVHFIQAGHETIEKELSAIALFHGAIFNLGYLPGADKSITTLADTTLLALDQIMDKLAVGGRILVVIYWGHQAGKTERKAVLAAASNYSQAEFQVSHYEFINQINCPPSVLAIERIDEAKS